MADQIELPIDGGCTCGAVRYRVSREPLIVHCCHCYWCQRGTGSAFVINAMIESDGVELLRGDAEKVPTPTASGNVQDIVRCVICRDALWSHYSGLDDKVCFVRVGTLDRPGSLPPDIHIYTDSKQDWVSLPDSVRAFPEYYDLKKVWSDENQARLRSLF